MHLFHRHESKSKLWGEWLQLSPNYPGLQLINQNPLVFDINNFLSGSTCDMYIKRAITDGTRIKSQTFSSATSQLRDSTTWYMKYSDVPELLNAAEALTMKPIECFEEPQIVKYEVGQQFSWHYDAIPASLNINGGQRIATLLVYLNDVALGGATCFKDLKLAVNPQKGKALIFFPCFTNGTVDSRLLHAGQVAGDTKWIAQM